MPPQELGRICKCWFNAVVANQPHQSPNRLCVTERNDVYGIVCVQRNQISLRNRQLASINTVYIFLYIYLQLYINFPKTLSHTSPLFSHSPTTPHPTCPRMFVAPRRAANQASLTIRRLANPLSIIFIGHGDLAPPWLQLQAMHSASLRLSRCPTSCSDVPRNFGISFASHEYWTDFDEICGR